MKAKISTNLKKINRQELKNVKGAAAPIRNWVCCTSNEEGHCCEWAMDIWNCRYIYC